MRKRKLKPVVAPSGPKRLDCSTVLPGIFDTLWDAKIGRDLFLIPDFRSNNHLHRLLAEFGFDVREWLERVGRLWTLREAYEEFGKGSCERLGNWADADSNAAVAACELADREALRPLQIAYVVATDNAMDRSPLVTEDMVVALLTRSGLFVDQSYSVSAWKARMETM